jgi:NodT family efflux transporter outer membrane factor (OMF) lipoprotein
MKALIFSVISCLLLAGCKVGPDYQTPEVVVPEQYVEDQPGETFVVEDEDLISWWTIFDDPFLNELLDIAVEQNYNYKIAIERVYQARSQYWVQFTQLLPEFDGASVFSRYRTSQSFVGATTAGTGTATAAVSPLHNFYQIGLDAIWELDIFGKFRRSAEASYDLWQASYEEMRGVKIVLISEVASTYATICSYQTKRNIAEQAVELDQELLALSKSRFQAGLTNQQEVEASIATLEADTAELSLLQAALKQSIYSLAILLGELPECVIEYFQIDRPIPRAEGKVPVAIPADLLRRRPDIVSSERQLAAATEQIGVAIADLFPTLSLTGSSSSFAANPLQGANVGLSSDVLNHLFRPASLIWGVGSFVTMPVFDFGKRTAAAEVQVSLANQAYYSYQQTVIAALQETEQALAVYFNEESREESLTRQVMANWKSLQLTADLFQAGLVSYTQVLQEKDIWLLSLNTLTDSQQTLTNDLIAIYRALGGNW